MTNATAAQNKIAKLARIAHARFQLDLQGGGEELAQMREIAQANNVDLAQMADEARRQAQQINEIAQAFAVARPLSQDEAEPFDVTEARDPQEAALLALQNEAERLKTLAGSYDAARLGY